MRQENNQTDDDLDLGVTGSQSGDDCVSLEPEEQVNLIQRTNPGEETEGEPGGNCSEDGKRNTEDNKGNFCLGGMRPDSTDQEREGTEDVWERHAEQQKIERRLKDIRREQEELEERREEDRRVSWRRWDELQGEKEHIRRDLEDLEDDLDIIAIQREKEVKLTKKKDIEKKLDAVKMKQKEIDEHVTQFRKKTRNELEELQTEKRKLKRKLQDVEEEREVKKMKVCVKEESLN